MAEQVCWSFSFRGAVVVVYYDDLTLALTRATAAGLAPQQAVRVVVRDDPGGDERWSVVLDSDGEAAAPAGVSFFPAHPDGLTVQFGEE
jgi:hypothetical protein